MLEINPPGYFVIVFVVLFILSCLPGFRYYSGLQFILEKIKPTDKNKLPTFPLWVVGIYVAAFGVASNRYENKVDIIENRINGIYAQISKDIHVSFARIDDVQEMVCPFKPEIYNPVSIVRSFLPLQKIRYEDGVQQLRELVEDWARKTETIEARLKSEPQAIEWLKSMNSAFKDGKPDKQETIGVLAGVDLRKAHLENADLSRAHLENADLSRAHLENANLWGAHLENADLRGARLKNANLLRAHLEIANLWGTYLENADLRGARLEKTCLCQADLKNAKGLTMAGLSQAFSLYGVKNLHPDLRTELEQTHPSLFKPDFEVFGCNDEGRGEPFLD